jgi:hypothetical protein
MSALTLPSTSCVPGGCGHRGRHYRYPFRLALSSPLGPTGLVSACLSEEIEPATTALWSVINDPQLQVSQAQQALSHGPPCIQDHLPSHLFPSILPVPSTPQVDLRLT